jgi:hypothetical protein
MQQASINYNFFSRDKARPSTGQKHANLCDFICAPVPADRLTFEQGVVRGTVTKGLFHHCPENC